MEDWFDVNAVMYELLYTIYALNVLTFFGTYIVDRFLGLSFGAFCFVGIVFIGQLFTALGTQWRWFWLAWTGRFIYSLGAETTSALKCSLISTWCQGRYLSLAFGLSLAIANLTEFANWNLTPTIQAAYGSPAPMWVGLSFCLFSILSSLGLWGFSYWADSKGLREKQPTRLPQIRDLLKFSGATWATICVAFLWYISFYSWDTIGSAQLMAKYNLSTVTAGRYSSMTYFLSVFSPVIGICVDFTGFHLTWLTVGGFVLLTGHLLLALSSTALPPAVPMVFIGLGFATFSATLWTTFSMLAPPEMVSTGFGALYSLLALTFLVGPVSVGAILDATNNNYVVTSIVFAVLTSVAIAVCLGLIIHDYITQGVINTTLATAKRRKQKSAPPPTTNKQI
eukprot:TRINITY_DN270_c0_g4_i4.p1 TRINITY_DN270_c0_g4~~TRINITY_DN270_c0_g4_i4.p1  ORF type:complete len:439 (+),score=92.75 TRINITY_DN270_c0_g4_i4:134-1318(+)